MDADIEERVRAAFGYGLREDGGKPDVGAEAFWLQARACSCLETRTPKARWPIRLSCRNSRVS